MKKSKKCVLCNGETNYIADLSSKNEWLFKKKKVPMCIDCFCALLDHKYYTHSDDESSYLYKEINV